MAIDFPNDPSVNDTYTVGSRTWTYTGVVWALTGYSGISATLSELDGGVFDSIAPYNGGNATTTATQVIDGGTP